MALRRTEFEALRTLLKGGAVGEAQTRHLEAAGLVGRGGAVTPAGLEAMAPYRVDNAVIMAAGLSHRFVPLSYERPKGLYRVRGQVLVERQIEQLVEAGVPEVCVVAGYRHELFSYLEDRYPEVTVVVNREYASRNNSSSLRAVEDRLSNTYVCSSDDYFEENPFEAYEWCAYYSARYAEGETDEWVMACDDDGRIVGVEVGGSDGWYMIGHAYFDRAFSSRFRAVLDAEYDLPATAPKLWEELFVDHIDEFRMVVRRFEGPTVHEFDSLDDVRGFDPSFLDGADSAVLDRITSALGCTRAEIRDAYPLEESLTNLSCHFATDVGEFVYRHPGVGTEEIVDRDNELAALVAARDHGFDTTFMCADPGEGWKISRFVPDAATLDPHTEEGLARAMAVARRLHRSGITLPNGFDSHDEAERYTALLRAHGAATPPGFGRWERLAASVRRAMAADGAPVTVTHNDFFDLNFLIERDGTFNLIDWEYAGMGDPANDLATLAVCCELSEGEVERAVDLYFEGRATDGERRHWLAMVGVCGWCWYCWGLLKGSEGAPVGRWLDVYRRYAERYLALGARLYGLGPVGDPSVGDAPAR